MCRYNFLIFINWGKFILIQLTRNDIAPLNQNRSIPPGVDQIYSFSISEVSNPTVPEPTTMALFSIGMATAFVRKKYLACRL